MRVYLSFSLRKSSWWRLILTFIYTPSLILSYQTLYISNLVNNLGKSITSGRDCTMRFVASSRSLSHALSQ